MASRTRVDPAEQMPGLAPFYRGWRPTRLGKLWNSAFAWAAEHGLTPPILLALQVRGRRTGQLHTNVLVPTMYAGQRYLVSMLGGNSEWVRNVRAAGGHAFIKRGRSYPIVLTEIATEQRAPILKAYCEVATRGRHHFTVAHTAPLSEFDAIAAHYPVFRIDTATVPENQTDSALAPRQDRGSRSERPVGYAARVAYRRPTPLRRAVNGVVAWLAGMGFTPADTICLEVAGRKSGKPRAFAVTMAILNGEQYLVSLAGESDWVRNLRATGGKAVIKHRNRTEVNVEELAVERRAVVLQAYLTKRALSTSASAAARDYFGVDPHPSLETLERVARHYPVFKVIGYPTPGRQRVAA